MLLKKMGHESVYKKRFLWIDVPDRSFHWSKQSDRESMHKSVSLAEGGDVSSVEFRSRPAKHRGKGPEPAMCLSLLLHTGDSIDVQVRRLGVVMAQAWMHMSCVWSQVAVS